MNSNLILHLYYNILKVHNFIQQVKRNNGQKNILIEKNVVILWEVILSMKNILLFFNLVIAKMNKIINILYRLCWSDLIYICPDKREKNKYCPQIALINTNYFLIL